VSDNEFVPDSNQQEPGGQLRARLEAALKDLKKRDDELAELKTEATKRSLDGLFSELGVPEKARGFYRGDPDKAAIEKWIEAHADVLRLPDRPPPEQEQAVRNLQRADGLGEDSSLPSEDAWREAAAAVAKTSPNRDPAALDKFFAAAGVRKGTLTPPQMD
jgi:hypothetical protein